MRRNAPESSSTRIQLPSMTIWQDRLTICSASRRNCVPVSGCWAEKARAPRGCCWRIKPCGFHELGLGDWFAWMVVCFGLTQICAGGFSMANTKVRSRFAAKRYIRRDIPVVEYGGSMGIVACLLNRRLKNPGDHVVVEANPQNLPTLHENRDRNHCHFEILHGAAGGVGKSVRIYLGENALTASTTATTEGVGPSTRLNVVAILQSRGFEALRAHVRHRGLRA